MKSLYIIAALCLVTFVAAVDVEWPNSYTIDCVFRIGAADIEELTHFEINTANQQLRISYYDDLDFTVWNGLHAWDVYVAKDIQLCGYGGLFANAPQILPDMSLFELVDGSYIVNGLKVNKYVYSDHSEYEKPQVYTFYMTPGGTPVQWHMTGYNLYGGSHYDQYIIDYTSYTPNTTTDGAFDKPSQCSSSNIHLDRGISSQNSLLRALMSVAKAPEASATQDEIFDDFKRRYNKSYATAEETQMRRELFSRRLNMIREHNASGRRFTMKLNQFADLTLDEIHNTFTGKVKRSQLTDDEHYPNYIPHDVTPSGSLTDKTPIDWRLQGAPMVNGLVKDQGNCGSCWSFGVIGTTEGRLALKNGEWVNLSEQRVINCSWTDDYVSGNQACNGGDESLGLSQLTDIGFVEQTAQPYLSMNSYCDMTLEVDDRFKIIGYGNPESGNQDDLYTCLQDGPTAVGTAVPESFVFYAAGIYDDIENCPSDIDSIVHAVTLEGYGRQMNPDQQDETVEYWIIKNSWSSLWGDEGYIYITLENDTCSISQDPSYAVVE
ncbi:peptidase C1A [Aduncisulcus paluster]|uniref:Peptidase C1A n=1 Tax=Aduncisulcus paluster TaxID=2918883 RepID=A0ABQ5JSM7_9EUKA|nr:peptidase C1A [Aduncisulcus paluster]|eukprot:gnl/Carplike_NY0171/464_a645_3313.p1 GENE.gnl/Carplike_NY0171/464_a645_3313~~gnl/Carplike_NY0171/464_a645_3313.p1  ORF type:complete len:548 (-),score=151.15 gnl/Carplike_NY0171/464_a645_3313:31-1674(-)